MTDTDDARLAALAADLGARLRVSIGPWLVRAVRARGLEPTSPHDAEVQRVIADSTAMMSEAVQRLLAADIDEQHGNPLAVIRALLGPLNDALTAAGVQRRPRDPFAERAFPADVHDLSPASFAEIDESLTEPGLMWGAAKAHVHLARRRRRNAD